ncbi:MAG: hypothetical protein EBZ77_13050, partial [Chitinophagia bacterium]|nr:hypothetical protein [Chitinophagia bacterium]
MRKLFSGFVATIALLLLSVGAQATHIFAVDLNYTLLHDSTYKITLVVYGDCAPTGASAFASLPTARPQICIYNGAATTAFATRNLSIESPSAGTEVTPVCASEVGNTQCTNTASTTPGIKKFVYSDTFTTPVRSDAWRFVFQGNMSSGGTGFGTYSAGRSSTITSITSAGTTDVFLVDTLKNSIFTNSSPNLSVLPTPFFCTNRSNSFNPAAVDADADSLSFALIAAQQGRSTCFASSSGSVGYATGYSATTPVNVSGGGTFSFTPSTGQMDFTTSTVQRADAVYNIREFRYNSATGRREFVGNSQREMTLLLLSCTSTPPSGTISSASGGTIADSTHFQACAGTGAISFHVLPTAPDTANIIKVTS